MKALYSALFLLPAFLSLLFFQWKLNSLDELETHIYQLETKAALVKSLEEKNTLYLDQLQTATKDDHKLESLVLLGTEGRRVQAIYAQDKENPLLGQRLAFLKSGKNRISLVEEKRRSYGKLREIEEKLAHPVEMDEEDLVKLIPLLESKVVREFDLTKKTAASEEEVYVVDLKMIKREVL